MGEREGALLPHLTLAFSEIGPFPESKNGERHRGLRMTSEMVKLKWYW